MKCSSSACTVPFTFVASPSSLPEPAGPLRVTQERDSTSQTPSSWLMTDSHSSMLVYVCVCVLSSSTQTISVKKQHVSHSRFWLQGSLCTKHLSEESSLRWSCSINGTRTKSSRRTAKEITLLPYYCILPLHQQGCSKPNLTWKRRLTGMAYQSF